MKFLHAADIHLDSPLSGLARRAEIPAGVVDNPTRRAFAAMIDLAIAEDVAFVLIAGDLYDADWKDYSTGLFFAQQMRRLAPRRCFLIRGNHDARSVITRSLTLPANVQEFSSRAAHSIPLLDLGIALHGRSFPDRAVPEDFSANYPDFSPGLLNIGLLHTSAEDPGRHDTYAPCSIAALLAKGYDYWALGHIHDRRELSDSPRIVFPGNVQGRHVNEPGAKGATLVEVQDRRIVSVEHRSVDVLRWAQPRVDLDGAETMAELTDKVRDALASEIGNSEGRPVIARVRLEGATSLHSTFLRDPAAIEAECRNAAAFVAGEIYIEGVRNATRSPSAVADHSELRAAFSASLEDPALLKRLLSEFGTLANLLPRGTRGGEIDLPRDEAELKEMLPEAWEAVMHELAERNPA